jgi:hypothetical protein
MRFLADRGVRINDVLNQSSAELSRGAIAVAEDGRYRLRKLPIGS